MFSFTRRDVHIIVGVSAFFIALTIAPYLYGWIQAGGDVYTWTHSLAVGDFFVYYSYIDQLANGIWFPVNLYTAETTQGILQAAWMIPAFLVKVFGISAGVAFHLYRLALIPIFVAVVVAFQKRVLAAEQRLFQILFILTSSGVGFFAPLFIEAREVAPGQFSWPMDLWVPEANSFLTLYHSPHILLSSILLITALLCTLTFVLDGKKHALSVAAFSTFLLMFIHPFYAVTVWLVPGVYTLLLFCLKDPSWRRSATALGVLVLASLPGVSYYGWLFFTDTAFAHKAGQNVLPTTSLPITLMSYGGLLLFSIIAIVRRRASRDRAWLFLACWAVLGFVLLYFPVSFQRRLSEGLHLPLALLTLSVLVPWVRTLTKGYRLLLMGFLLILFALSNIVTVKHDLYLLERREYALVIPAREVRAARWIRREADRNDVVLAPLTIGPWLPGVARIHVIVGHEIETLGVDEKIASVARFYASHGGEEQSLLRDTADLVWVQDDPKLETQLESLGLERLYEEGGISLFRTKEIAENR